MVVPGYPHHVTQRGNRRMKTFFSREDYATYLDLLCEGMARSGCAVWAYCLMPNHVHLVVIPEAPDSLAMLFRHVHRHYTRYINFREQWRGHLWQERFHSTVMDEPYLLAAVRYVELNPVRAGLCAAPEDWTWSSVHAHITRTDDRIVTVKPMLDRVADWSRYLSVQDHHERLGRIREHTGTGRPLGGDRFIATLESVTGRTLHRKKPGPKNVRLS